MRKMGIAGLALALAGALVFGAGYVGARGDLSVVNGSFGPISVHLPSGSSSKPGSSASGIGGGRDKPMTTPAPVPTPVPTHHDEPEHTNGGQHHENSADCQTFPAGDVRSIELDISLASLVLYPSADGSVSVSSDSLDDFSISLDKSGRLRVESRDRITVFGLNLGATPTLEIAAPAALDSLEAEVACGGIQLENLSLGRLKLESDMGDVYVYGVGCQSAELSSSCGSVQAHSVTSSGKLEVESDMGDVSVENCEAASELKASSDCGKVTLNACTAKSAELDADMGDISACRLSVTDRVKIDCDCGAVEFKSLSAGKGIEIENSMGSIEGTLSGSINDYSIESGTDLGSCNLPSKLELGSIKLKAHADCGSIDIGFEGD